MKVVRADQSESNTKAQQLSSELLIKLDEIPELTFEKAIAKYDEMILDIGPDTAERFAALLQQAGTILWNGPVGVFEFE